jgi:hypothetical protein
MKKFSAGCINSTWHCARVLPALRDRLKSWSRAFVLLLRLGYCPLIGRNPG